MQREKRGHAEGKGLEEELTSAEAQRPGKEEEQGRDGPVVGLVVFKYH